MKRVTKTTIGFIAALMLGLSTASSASNPPDKQWAFTVYLDGDEIGTHRFTVSDIDEHRQVSSNASLDVKFLFFTAYSYRHKDIEHWRNGCLDSIAANTDDNGDLFEVTGKAVNSGFVVSATGVEQNLSGCIQTFAYWDPEFLQQTALLNSQTGEMVSVKSQFIGNEPVDYRGEKVDARRYRLFGEDLQIDLWYSDDDHWLALESLTESGNVIRYSMP